MAFGSSSSVFQEWNRTTNNALATGYAGLSVDAVKVALFNNSVTPDRAAAVASTGFNTGTWTTANEVIDATNWVSGGRALASKTFTTPSTGVFMFDAADLAGGGNVTITNAFGCLVYDDAITAGTVADQGICFLSFSGAASVTAGTFTIQFSASGLARWTSS
jgi:hypothetical protein